MNEIDVVSFDVFDTLLGRALFSPFDVFDKVQDLYNKKNNNKITGFRKNRIFAEGLARKKHKEKLGYQDVTLEEIYQELQEIYLLDDSDKNALISLELYVEDQVLRPRGLGLRRMHEAKNASKDVVLISDMYLSDDFINKKLAQSNINFHVDLFLSSVFRKRKHEGELFLQFLETSRVKPNRVLHIGDNPIGDYETPSRIGIKCDLIPRSNYLLSVQSDNWRDYFELLKKSRTFAESAIFGLMADRFFDDPIGLPAKKTDFNGDPFMFGYCALGPLVLGFSSFIKETCRQFSVKKIIFLSRDGKIFKDVFDIFNRNSDYDTEYFYFSRRAARVASIHNKGDIYDIVSQPVYSTTIGAYFLNKFGLDPKDLMLDVLDCHGISDGVDHKIGSKFSKDVLIDIAFAHENIIYQRAEIERNGLAYAISQKVNPDEEIALVDIGYAGTLQLAFEKILGRGVLGIYLATFNTADSQPVTGRMTGYLCNSSHPSYGDLGIVSHRFMYENVICDSGATFMNYEIDRDGRLLKNFGVVSDDDSRKNFVLMAHSGARVFAQDFLDRFFDICEPCCSSEFSVRLLDIFIRNPHPVDASMFAGIKFEDSMGPDGHRFLVPTIDLLLNEDAIIKSIWKEGASAAVLYAKFLRKKKTSSYLKAGTGVESTEKKNFLLTVESAMVRRFVSDRLYRKYQRDRSRFFIDGKGFFMKAYSKFFV